MRASVPYPWPCSLRVTQDPVPTGEKIAQEHLGLQALLGDPTLIAGLAS
jgi:hypothetical protein